MLSRNGRMYSSEMECRHCSAESGSSLVCSPCRRDLTDYKQDQLTDILRWICIEKVYDPRRNQYQCFHCLGWFAEDEICADHWPHTKKARPDLRFYVRNVRASCQACNTSGAK